MTNFRWTRVLATLVACAGLLSGCGAPTSAPQTPAATVVPQYTAPAAPVRSVTAPLSCPGGTPLVATSTGMGCSSQPASDPALSLFQQQQAEAEAKGFGGDYQACRAFGPCD